MLPITRANLQSFCRNCLREFTATETTHDIEQKFIQRNRLFPQKVCHCCYIKIKTLKGFQDRANLATGVLKLIAEERLNVKSDQKETETLERRLRSFCRLCLKSNAKSIANCSDEEIFKDIKDCTGLRIEKVPIRLEKTDDPLADDVRYSHSICVRCQTTLKGFVEYRQVAKQTINYLQSILDDDDDNEGDEEINKTFAKTAEEHLLNNTANQSIKIDNVDVSRSRFNSKFVVNVIENELNELLSEQEDVLSSDSMNRSSIRGDKFNEEEIDSTKKSASRTVGRNRRENKQRCHQTDELQIKKRHRKFKSIGETMYSEQDEDIHAEQKLQTNQIEPYVQLETFKEAATENEVESTLFVETLLKTEIAEEFIKDEFQGNDRETFIDNTNNENVNPIGNFNNFETKQSESVKQEDFDSEFDANYESDNVDSASDSNSEDICLAKLVSKKKQTRAGTLKTKNKTRRKTQNKASAKSEQKAKYKCEQCNKSFFKKHTIEAHLKRHKGASKAFACKQCESSFTTYQALQRHASIHDTKGTTLRSKRQQIAMRYKSSRECPKCHLVLKRHLDLADHIRRAHNGIYVFKCKICGKCLSTQAALNRHEQNHSDERPFACPFCDKRYNYETELKVHMQRHTTDPALLCPICKTARANAEELQRHIASHRKPHQCSKCGKVFTKAYSLHQHDLSVHLNLKVHKCPQCDLSFKGRKTLTLHRLHHDPTGRPETCRVCGLYFRTKRGRLRHTSKFHPNAELPPEEPSTTAADDGRIECCEKCPLRFKTRRGLMLHTKKTHEKGQRISKTEDELKEKYGNRSEVCEICQLQCFSKKGLSRHIRKSHPDLAEAKDQEKTANCSEACVMCPLKFRTARGLLLHTKRMHRDMSVQQELKSLTTGDVEEQKLTLPLNWL